MLKRKPCSRNFSKLKRLCVFPMFSIGWAREPLPLTFNRSRGFHDLYNLYNLIMVFINNYPNESSTIYTNESHCSGKILFPTSKNFIRKACIIFWRLWQTRQKSTCQILAKITRVVIFRKKKQEMYIINFHAQNPIPTFMLHFEFEIQ